MRGRVLAGGVWTVWLLFLCIHRTGDGMLVALPFVFKHSLSTRDLISEHALRLPRGSLGKEHSP